MNTADDFPVSGTCTQMAEHQASCDGQTTCDYLYSGQLIEGCALNYTADYVKFIYHCTDFVACSACASALQEPNNGDIILFPGVETNQGGGYDNITSVFTCPQSGYYYIYFNVILRVEASDHCDIEIRKDGDIVVTVRLTQL